MPFAANVDLKLQANYPRFARGVRTSFRKLRGTPLLEFDYNGNSRLTATRLGGVVAHRRMRRAMATRRLRIPNRIPRP